MRDNSSKTQDISRKTNPANVSVLLLSSYVLRPIKKK
jgi:hypothetical protein